MSELKSLSQMNWRLRLLGWRYIPMLRFVGPKLLELTESTAVMKIKLRRKTKNHLGSMYFGALAVGADTAAGIYAFAVAEKIGVKLHFSFKSSKMEFLKRAESDISFVCNDGDKIKAGIQQALDEKERINFPVLVEAYDDQNTLVSTMTMELSVRVK